MDGLRTDDAELVASARALAADLLDVPQFRDARWRHVQAVERQASLVAAGLRLAADECQVLVAAAWLHDVGYAPSCAATGFHPLDGAEFLRSRGFHSRAVSLVAHHTGALVEATVRGLAPALATFPDEETCVRDALWMCDLTVGPTGQVVTVDERLAEIRRRYGPEHVVSRAIDRAEPQLRAAADRTQHRLAQSTCGWLPPR